jgi:beta-fructofuranosidase
MPLEIADQWVWDFWLAQDGSDWHIFYLRAPKSLGDPDHRHRNATIGHARSGDLSRWEIVADPFALGPVGAWDDLALWTGSVVDSGDLWWMFYTGISTADDGKVQRIGAAASRDLTIWNKVAANPLCVSDPLWYEQYDPASWYEEAWRDPWVFPDPAGDGYHMFITARDRSGPPASRGVIGHATSPDLVSWTVQPPVARPRLFGHLEVSQQVTLAGRHYLLFCVQGEMQPGIPVASAKTGVGYLVAEDPIGPYHPGPTPFVASDRPGTLYAGRVIFQGQDPFLIATRHDAADGSYVGTISDPMPLIVSTDGALSITEPPTSGHNA